MSIYLYRCKTLIIDNDVFDNLHYKHEILSNYKLQLSITQIN